MATTRRRCAVWRAAYLMTGKPELAGQPLAVAFADTPDDPKLLLLIGVADDFVNQHEEAQARYRRGLELAPGDPGLTVDLALSLALSGNYDEAVNAPEAIGAIDQFDAPRAPDPGVDLRAARQFGGGAGPGTRRPRRGYCTAKSGLLRQSAPPPTGSAPAGDPITDDAAKRHPPVLTAPAAWAGPLFALVAYASPGVRRYYRAARSAYRPARGRGPCS